MATTDEKILNALDMYNSTLKTTLDGRFVKQSDIDTDSYVTKVTGKDLSSNDFTDALKNKLDNVDTDTYVTKVSGKDLSSNDFTDALKNKLDAVDTDTYVTKVSGKDLSTNDFTDALKNKLDNVDTDTYVTSDTLLTKIGGMTAQELDTLRHVLGCYKTSVVFDEVPETNWTVNAPEGVIKSPTLSGGKLILDDYGIYTKTCPQFFDHTCEIIAQSGEANPAEDKCLLDINPSMDCVSITLWQAANSTHPLIKVSVMFEEKASFTDTDTDLTQTHHLAYCLHENNLYYFADGVLKQTLTLPNLEVTENGGGICIGDGIAPFVGSVSEFRINGDVHTANFTPETSFTKTAGTKSLLHFDY